MLCLAGIFPFQGWLQHPMNCILHTVFVSCQQEELILLFTGHAIDGKIDLGILFFGGSIDEALEFPNVVSYREVIKVAEMVKSWDEVICLIDTSFLYSFRVKQSVKTAQFSAALVFNICNSLIQLFCYTNPCNSYDLPEKNTIHLEKSWNLS